jgi:hypothetical protein
LYIYLPDNESEPNVLDRTNQKQSPSWNDRAKYYKRVNKKVSLPSIENSEHHIYPRTACRYLHAAQPQTPKNTAEAPVVLRCSYQQLAYYCQGDA